MTTTPSSPSDTPSVQPDEAAVESTPVAVEAAAPATAPDAVTAPDTAKEAGPSTAQTGARLAELFPALFKGPARPFKLRIQVDIQERAPGEFTKQTLSAFFRRHTGSTSYLQAVAKGEHRFDLDGNPAGELSEEHRQLAQEELARRRERQLERRQQEQADRKAAFKAQAQQQRAQQRDQQQAERAQHDERRQRVQLLRDFESTRLTEANFCALKGIQPDALPALLAQAREDLKAMPPRPERGPRPPGSRDERREPRGEDRRGGRPNPSASTAANPGPRGSRRER
jgi:ProP effector